MRRRHFLSFLGIIITIIEKKKTEAQFLRLSTIMMINDLCRNIYGIIILHDAAAKILLPKGIFRSLRKLITQLCSEKQVQNYTAALT